MKNFETMDGNEAVARVAFQLNEVVALFPITPASPMGEWADAWAAAGVKNLWGTVPAVIEMQSEGGAAGASFSRAHSKACLIAIANFATMLLQKMTRSTFLKSKSTKTG